MLSKFGPRQTALFVKLMVLVSVVTLSACASIFNGSISDSSGEYAMANDSVVLENVDLSMLQPIVPVKETRTAAGNKSPYSVNGETYYVMEERLEESYSETGMASWYGRKFHGHQTANGEIYDMFQLSAAHKSLPIPGYLNVTNLDNNKSIVVRVNDRGPFYEGRVIDLSYAAAVMLDFADAGTARVRVEAIVPDQLPPMQTLPEEILASQMEATFNQDNNNQINTNSVTTNPIPTNSITTSPLDTNSIDTNSIDTSVANNSASIVTLEEVLSERVLIEEESGNEFLQIGAFANLTSAQNLASQAEKLSSVPVFIRTGQTENSDDVLHRVRLGPVDEIMDVQELIQILADAGLGTAFRVRE